MEILVLVLCIVLAAVSGGVLLVAGSAVYKNYRLLQDDLLREQRAPVRIVSVRQEAGEVRFAYLTHPAEEEAQ